MKMIDRLFLSVGCDECNIVKSHLNFDVAKDDDFRGKMGQEFQVLSALSDSASRDLMDRYNLENIFMPALVMDNGQILMDVDDIVLYLQEHGLSVDG